MEKDVAKTFWADAAKYGGIFGLLLIAVTVINWLFKLSLNGMGIIDNLLTVFIIVFCLYYFTRRRAALYGSDGFSYSQSVGFMFAMLVFAGIIYGFGTFLMQNYIAPDYYEHIWELTRENLSAVLDSPEMEDALEESRGFMRNPFIMVISGIMSMVFAGGIVSLVVAVFTQRKPDIFLSKNV